MDKEAFREFQADAGVIAEAAATAARSAFGTGDGVVGYVADAIGALTQAVLLVARELHAGRNR